jgi:uncharacterized membrane protein YgcG
MFRICCRPIVAVATYDADVEQPVEPMTIIEQREYNLPLAKRLHNGKMALVVRKHAPESAGGEAKPEAKGGDGKKNGGGGGGGNNDGGGKKGGDGGKKKGGDAKGEEKKDDEKPDAEKGEDEKV